AQEREQDPLSALFGRARGPRAADLGQERVEKPGLRPEAIRVSSPPPPQRVEELLRDARRGALRDLAVELGDGRAHVLGHREREARRELAGAEHADRILAEANEGVADRAHDAPLEILDPAHEIEDGIRRDVVEKPVDREVAAEGVLFGRPERVVRADEEIVVSLPAFFALHGVGNLAERRNLDDFSPLEEDVRETKAPP